MGDRAVIGLNDSDTGIYVHWNGDPATVLGYLGAAKALGYRDPEDDPEYAVARLCGLIAFDLGLADNSGIGVGDLKHLDTDNGDNGTYIVGADWKVVKWYGSGSGELPFDEKTVIDAERKTAMLVHRVKELEKL